MEKLQIVYQRAQDQVMEQNKISFCIEGKEDKHFFAILGGKETESDDEEEQDVAGGEGA